MQNVECRNQKLEAGSRIGRFFQHKIRHALFGVFRSSFCIRHSAFCLSSGGQARLQRLERSDCGQAMVEFTVALVAILAVAVGTILLNKMELAHISSMADARATAGAQALDVIYYVPMGAQFIADWEAGADDTAYTSDDEPIPDGTAIAMIGNITANADLDTITAPTNAISRLRSLPDIGEFYLVKGSESSEIVLHSIPGVQRLFSREHAITVGSDAWLVWTGGIY
jgi:hypothetical protein